MINRWKSLMATSLWAQKTFPCTVNAKPVREGAPL
jgi:hypothetical protein